MASLTGRSNTSNPPNPPNPINPVNPVNPVKQSQVHSVTLSAIVFAAGTLLSRVLGLIRDMMTARYFSVEVRDAFLVAFRLPNLFRRLLGEGSLSVSFIPVFVELLQGKRVHEAHRLVCGVWAILMSISITCSLLGIIFMEDLLRLLLSGEEYMKIAGKLALTVSLARIMFSFLVLMSMYAFFMAILNSLKQFALSALAPALLNVALIMAALISDRWAAPELVLAWSVIVGGFLQMGILIRPVWKAGYLPSLSSMFNVTSWLTPEVKRVLRAVLPSMLGMSIMQFTQIVNLHFASHLPQGSHSALYFADRVLELPLSLFVVSIGSALLPTLSGLFANGDREGMAATINHYIRLILFVALPAATGMYLLAQPISEVLFMGRHFTHDDAVVVAGVLRVYSFGLIVSSGVRILAQGFYAIQNTWFPAVAGSTALLLHLFFAYFFTQAFGINGLSAATVCSALVNLIMLAVVYSWRVASLQWLRLFKSLAQFIVACLILAIVVQMYQPLIDAWASTAVVTSASSVDGVVLQYHPRAATLQGMAQMDSNFTLHIKKSVVLFLSIGSGLASYLIAAYFLKIPEFRETADRFQAKIKSKMNKMKKA